MNYDEIVKKVEDFYAPSKALAELTLGNVEKMAELNMAAMKANTETALTSWKAVLDVKDVESAQKFFEEQRTVAEASAKRAQDDAKAIVAMGQEYAAEVKKLSEESIENVKKLAA